MFIVHIVSPITDVVTIAEIDDISLLFFDTFIASITAHLIQQSLSIDQLTYFEYEDDEGDRIAVRDDDGLKSMLVAIGADIDNGNNCIVRIYLPNSDSNRNFFVDTETINPTNIDVHALRHISLISSGRSGTVYKTLDTNNDRIIAVKCIYLDVSDQMQKEIIAETRILSQCKSAFIVDFCAALFRDNQFFVCMEYMDGGSLDRYGALDESVLRPVTVSIVNGLQYLWQNKIMHRDVKPSNILVNSIGSVKLCDFGVSKQLQRSIAASYVGTNAYMAPERILGGDYRIHSDIWSLGLTIVELAIGRFPLLGATTDGRIDPTGIAQLIVYGDLPSFADQLAHMQLSLRTLIAKCLIRDPSQRCSPSELMANSFINEHNPIDHTSVAKFVNDFMQRCTSSVE